MGPLPGGKGLLLLSLILFSDAVLGARQEPVETFIATKIARDSALLPVVLWCVLGSGEGGPA